MSPKDQKAEKKRDALSAMIEVVEMMRDALSDFKRNGLTLLGRDTIEAQAKSILKKVTNDFNDPLEDFLDFSSDFLRDAKATPSQEQKIVLLFDLKCAAHDLLGAYNTKVAEPLLKVYDDKNVTVQTSKAFLDLLIKASTAASHGHWLISTEPELKTLLRHAKPRGASPR